ncbi:hypothetical protein DRO57_08730 [Candidatus Bathyarchaeota archaeon]|nr:MAG: hypothetical protein DRO57_08730 [Candidatus Bathyarchaeota archaeon]
MIEMFKIKFNRDELFNLCIDTLLAEINRLREEVRRADNWKRKARFLRELRMYITALADLLEKMPEAESEDELIQLIRKLPEKVATRIQVAIRDPR